MSDERVVDLEQKRSLRGMSRDQLIEEVERLRDLIDARPHFEDQDWAVLVHVDDGFRDRMAARAYIQAQGNEFTAMRILGWETAVDDETGTTKQGLTPDALKRLARALFLNDTVKEIVTQTARKADAYKDQIIDRLIEQAMYGEAGNSLRAAGLLAKMNVGWLAPTKMQVQSASVSFTHVLSNPAKLAELTSHLDHEPGDAVRIASEAAERALPVTHEHEPDE